MSGNSIFSRICSFLSWINITYDCNLSCPWCYASMAKNDLFMSIETFSKVVRLITGLGGSRIVLSGGEATIHPNFLEMIRISRFNKCKVLVNSHGLAFADKNFLYQAIDSGMSVVNLSLKGVNREDFLINTGLDGFDSQKEAIGNILSDGRTTLILNVTLNSYSINNFKKILIMAKNLGIKHVTVTIAVPVEGSDPFCGGSIPTEDEFAAAFGDIIDDLVDSKLDYFFRLDMPLCKLVEKGYSEKILKINFLTSCFLREGNSLIFDPCGGVIPCNTMPGVVLGRIGEDFNSPVEYERFMHSNDVLSRRKSLLVEDKPECLSCHMAIRCCRGCSAFKIHAACAAL
jgi:radical SAM protein with 4Fe4S-binding SPASM domain